MGCPVAPTRMLVSRCRSFNPGQPPPPRVRSRDRDSRVDCQGAGSQLVPVWAVRQTGCVGTGTSGEQGGRVHLVVDLRGEARLALHSGGHLPSGAAIRPSGELDWGMVRRHWTAKAVFESVAEHGSESDELVRVAKSASCGRERLSAGPCLRFRGVLPLREGCSGESQGAGLSPVFPGVPVR